MIKFLIKFIFMCCLPSCCSFILRKNSTYLAYISIKGAHSCYIGDEIKLEAVGYDKNLEKIENGFCPVWRINESDISLAEFVPPAGKKVILKTKLPGICHFVVRHGEINITDEIEIRPKNNQPADR